MSMQAAYSGGLWHFRRRSLSDMLQFAGRRMWLQSSIINAM
jgi:hypothetical protein